MIFCPQALEQHYQYVLLGKRGRPDNQRTVHFDDHRVAMRRLYQLIREEKPYFEERIDPRDFFRIFIVEPQQLSERIRAQSGAFLVSAFHERFERAEIRRLNDNTPIYAHYELTIPAECKAIIVEGLRMLNITRETLFPGLDSSAAAITKSYRQRREPGGG